MAVKRMSNSNAIAEAAAIAKIAASTAEAASTANANVERKVDAVLQDTKYIKEEQVQARAEMSRHVVADDAQHAGFREGQSELKLKVALLSQQDANDSKGFSLNWGTITSIVTMILAALIAWFLSGK